ncbi:DNA phosphorothioation-associated putative methyltransferase [Variovorax sp. 1140]|uniref:DNA phosphorothioation-associated putative methyltransferase n=1 Tax=Variovorax atrisoli TaxID=3394203 RepID=UPI0033947335
MSSPGKRIADEFYVHLSALDEISDLEVSAEIRRALHIFTASPTDQPNVAKVNLRTGRVSLLSYPDFSTDPFPALSASWTFPPGVSHSTFRSYVETLNQPILHRKELLVGAKHPEFRVWSAITASAEALGLFDEASTIGFRLNWERLIESKGYKLVGDSFVPIGNDDSTNPNGPEENESGSIQRHKTALARSGLSAPVQLLARHGFLHDGATFFDYGCGRGNDIDGLKAQSIEAEGWDPYYRPTTALVQADVVNLGFVINVIEDQAERVVALTKAFALARSVLAIGVMLHSGEVSGTPYGDGLVTSRNTFQKYFSQSELKDYVEQVLHRDAFMVGPGVAFVFSSSDAEQRFMANRYRSSGLAKRLLVTHRRRPISRASTVKQSRPSKMDLQFAAARSVLDELWSRTLDLGRHPEPDEVTNLEQIDAQVGGLARAFLLLARYYDQSLLKAAGASRGDDLRVLLASQQFAKRAPYRQLEPRLQRDVRAFFGSYRDAQSAGLALLFDAADPHKVLNACRTAAESGLGWLDGEHSFQIHTSLVDRLPAVLRAYVAAGLILWDALSDIQLVKIHITSGKLTLMEYADFDEDPRPLLRRRIKVNIRKLSYDLFEYGTPAYPMPVLYWKSRYLHEDYPGFAEQLAFDEALEKLGIPGGAEFGPSALELQSKLEANRLEVDGLLLRRSARIPSIDEKCGAHFTYRSLIECGETQRRTGLSNVPFNPETYNALLDLCTQLLDPIIEYFGPIRLTYGFSSAELARHIGRGIAPKLDQHIACEHGRTGKLVCVRGGAACDFIVDDEDMREVAHWICATLPFDRMYFYGVDRPIHLSYSTAQSREAFEMVRTSAGRLMPREFRSEG